MDALTDAGPFERAAGGLRRRGESAQAAGAASGWGPRRRWEWIRDLTRLTRGRTLAELGAITVESAGTEVVRVEQKSDLGPPRLPTPEEARAAALGRLELVFGIGSVTAERLRGRGIVTVDQLCDVEPYAAVARQILAEWDEGDLPSICSRLTTRLGGFGHLLSSVVCGLVDPQDVAFMDLETLGLWHNMIFLAGIGRFRGGVLEITQFLAPGAGAEPAVVACAAAELAGARVAVTFNGRTADMGWLASRAFYHGLPPLAELAHVDLVYGVRSYAGDRLPDARLVTVEQHLLGQARADEDVPGWVVPALYEHYLGRPAARIGLLIPVLDHNRSDIETLATLLGLLGEEAGSWG